MVRCVDCARLTEDHICSLTDELMHEVENEESCLNFVKDVDPPLNLDPQLQHLLNNTKPLSECGQPADWTYKISRESLAETLLIELVKRPDGKLNSLEDWAPRLAVLLADGLVAELKKEPKT